MIRFDRLIFKLLFGLAIPVLCFLIFWWTTLIFTQNEKIIMIVSLSGLCLGLLIDFLIILFFKPDIFKLSKPVLVIIYLFYNAWLFGFFMGVPVFHLALGVIAGFYWVRRLIYQNEIKDYKREIQRTSLFTSTVIGVVCLFSAVIALISKSTPSDLKGMFHLSFDISLPLLTASIIAGGIFLVIVQYYLTKIVMELTLKSNHKNVF
ncbi:MAG: hypothetical protein NTZ85_06350 [Bacteroidia bacterium]|nr:hypothetical protein [Bacteroidia bacterium]